MKGLKVELLFPMRSWLFILVLSLGATGLAAEKPHSTVSKKDRQAAARDFKQALELQKAGHVDEALLAVSRAVQLFPGNVEYLTAQQMLRQQMAGSYLQRGNRLAEAGDKAGAAAQFREALNLDPENSYLQERLRQVSPADDPEGQRTMEVLASVDQIELAPARAKGNIHVRGDTRSVYTEIGRAFNVSVQFDQTLSVRPMRFDLDDVDFYTAMRLAGKMSRTFWAPVSNHEVIVAADTQELRRQYERLSMRTFYLGNATSASDLTDVVNVLRSIFDVKIVSMEASRNTITVKAPRETVEAAASFIDNVMDARPEVMLDLQAFQYDTDKTGKYGLDLPTSFVVFNIPSEIRRVLGPDAQSVIDQLNRTGTIDPSTIPASALANLQGSPLLAPFVFFGKGQGLTGIATPPISGQLSLNSSMASSLEHVTLRAIDGETATFRVGDRFPIVTGTFSTVAVTAVASAAVGSSPQFQYEDLGLTLKVKPHYMSAGEVKLDFDLQIQALGSVSVNNIPELTSRSFKGNITAEAGEASVIAGEISDQELRSTQGYPAIGQVAGLQPVLNSNSRQRTHTQILVVVTPYVIRKPFHDKGTSVFWDLNQ
jgi:general secretion pathway protein D